MCFTIEKKKNNKNNEKWLHIKQKNDEKKKKNVCINNLSIFKINNFACFYLFRNSPHQKWNLPYSQILFCKNIWIEKCSWSTFCVEPTVESSWIADGWSENQLNHEVMIADMKKIFRLIQSNDRCYYYSSESIYLFDNDVSYTSFT